MRSHERLGDDAVADYTMVEFAVGIAARIRIFVAHVDDAMIGERRRLVVQKLLQEIHDLVNFLAACGA